MMINELENIWKEAVVAQFKVLSRNLLGMTEEKHEETQHNWSLGQDLDLGPLEYRGIRLERLKKRMKKLGITGLWGKI
jgi:hypothetical protein